MQIERLLLCVLMPPLAVWDKGTNTFILVLFFTVLGWVPGVIVAVGITIADAYEARQNRIRAETLDDMQRKSKRNERMVNLPDKYQSGEERLHTAQRSAQMVERVERKQKRESSRNSPHKFIHTEDGGKLEVVDTDSP